MNAKQRSENRRAEKRAQRDRKNKRVTVKIGAVERARRQNRNASPQFHNPNFGTGPGTDMPLGPM